MFRYASALAVLLCAVLPLHAAEKPTLVVRTFGPDRPEPLNPRYFLLSPEVVVDASDGSIRLARSVLVADETGTTDQHQAETLSERVQARKQFLVEAADVTAAELFLFGRAGRVQVNGTPLDRPQPLDSTGWQRAKVPPALLTAGLNDMVLSGRGSLLVEPGRQPGRSHKSTDGGKTWTGQGLGNKGDLQGEYLVRLRLGRHAPQGTALSQVIDLWAAPGEVAIPAQVSILPLPAWTREQPEGTRLAVSLRTGVVPTPDATWSAWTPLDRPQEAGPRHRWAQLRFELATDRPQATPRIPRQFDLRWEATPEPVPSQDRLVVKSLDGGPIRLTSVPFVYQEVSPRLKLLRQRYALDKVIAGASTEMEQLVRLRHWVRNQWHTAWRGDAASWMPPWDTHIILEAKDQPDCLTMCTHYAAVFTQCCLALGWTARHCILDHHCVSEVWVNEHRKWVMMDPGNSKERADCNLHFERRGTPLSALELHQALRSGQTSDLTVCFTPAAVMAQLAPLCRPDPEGEKAMGRPESIPAAELSRFPVCQLNNYRRYAFPGRNNYLHSLYPGELYQGLSSYFHDGYWWVGDTPDDPHISPEYSRHLSPSRPQDIDWSVNWTRIHLARTAKPGEVEVQLETMTPNFARYETAAEDAWKPTPGRFTWRLQTGANVLRVRSANQLGRHGTESAVEVQWQPAKP